MYFHVYLIYRFTRTFTDHSSVITRCWGFELQNGKSSLKSPQTLATQDFAPASFLSTPDIIMIIRTSPSAWETKFGLSFLSAASFSKQAQAPRTEYSLSVMGLISWTLTRSWITSLTLSKRIVEIRASPGAFFCPILFHCKSLQ